MTKKSRTILFYSLIGIFLLLAPASILYSQGYRFDFNTMKVVKTGGIFIKASPNQVKIYIDGKLAKRTDFFTGSSLIGKLLPKTYDVKVEKDGYFTWEKNLQVNETEVTEAKAVILFPQDPGFTDITASTASTTLFWKSLTQTPPAATPTVPVPKSVLAYQKVNGDFYLLNASGTVFRADSSLVAKQKINAVPFPVSTKNEYKLYIFQNYVFLQENQTLYLFDQDTGTFNEFFDKLSGLELSPDGRKLLYYSDNEIWIFFLQDTDSSPQRTAGEKIFLTRFSEKIGKIMWLNSDYLIFNAANNVKISEIDNRSNLNIYNIGNFPSPQIFFNQSNKELYILSSGNLFVSKPLLP